MVPRNLIIFLVLLWTMHHYRAKRIIKTIYRETKVVNYRQEDDDSNTLSMHDPVSCNCAVSMSYTYIILLHNINSTQLHLQGVAPRLHSAKSNFPLHQFM